MTKTGQIGTDNKTLFYKCIQPFQNLPFQFSPIHYASLAKLSLLTLDRDNFLIFFLCDVIYVTFILFNVICLPVFKYFQVKKRKTFCATCGPCRTPCSFFHSYILCLQRYLYSFAGEPSPLLYTVMSRPIIMPSRNLPSSILGLG
jgi:hypothetical protein